MHRGLMICKRFFSSRLHMYEGYSHGVYEQAKDFNRRVLRYITFALSLIFVSALFLAHG